MVPCRACRPLRHPPTRHELWSTLSHQQAGLMTPSEVNGLSILGKTTPVTTPLQSAGNIRRKNVFIRLASPCAVSSAGNYILEVKFVIRTEPTKPAAAAAALQRSRLGGSALSRQKNQRLIQPSFQISSGNSVCMPDPAQIAQFLDHMFVSDTRANRIS